MIMAGRTILNSLGGLEIELLDSLVSRFVCVHPSSLLSDSSTEGELEPLYRL